MATNNLPIDYQCIIMFFKKVLPITIGTNWQKQILYFTLAKYWQSIGNRYNTLVTIGKSLVEINMWKFYLPKKYKCIGIRLAIRLVISD